MLHPKHVRHLESHSRRIAAKWGIQLFHYSNAGNQLRLLLRTRSRRTFRGFLREMSGTTAIIVTGAKKGAALPRPTSTDAPLSALRGFWDGLAFTRIVAWGREFAALTKHLTQDHLISSISQSPRIRGAPS